MADDTQKDKPAPPVVAYKTFKNFLRSLAPAMPARIDKSVMTSLSGSTQNQLLQALRRLGCIGPTGTPEARLITLVKADGIEFQAALRQALESTYPFLQNNDLANVTMSQLQEHFATLGSGDTIRKAITFFIPAAKDAGFTLSPFIKEPGKRSSSNGRQKRTRAAKPDAQPSPPAHQQPPGKSGGTIQELLLEKFPNFDPTWPDDIKTKWFDNFTDLMKRAAP
jgi:hypothetical protein